MTRIDKYLKKLEGQRRSKPVTREMWQNWLAHPMTEIFFLSLDIRLLQETMFENDLVRCGTLAEIIDYEPHEITEGEKTDEE